MSKFKLELTIEAQDVFHLIRMLAYTLTCLQDGHKFGKTEGPAGTSSFNVYGGDQDEFEEQHKAWEQTDAVYGGGRG